MLLSSVALVAKPKNAKSKDSDKKADVLTNYLQGYSDTCVDCQKEIEEEMRVFQFPSVVPKTSEIDQQDKFANYPGDRVTIVTGDAMCLSVEKFYYTIVLQEEKKTDMTCVFRKKVLESKEVQNGRIETVVFALDCDQEFYITSSTYGDLELNYHPSNPRLDEPDERFFDVFYTQIGHAMIQPKLCRNMYLHHLDNSLSTQLLDLNWRCPEEYFFHFSAVPESVSKSVNEEKRVCTHKKTLKKCVSVPVKKAADESSECTKDNTNQCSMSYTQKLSTYGPGMDIHFLKDTINKYAIDLPTRKPTKSKRGLSTLFLGCFSAKSHKLVA